MNPVGPTLVIMAAGVGSRYGGLKQIDQFGPSGETIIDYASHETKSKNHYFLVCLF